MVHTKLRPIGPELRRLSPGKPIRIGVSGDGGDVNHAREQVDSPTIE
ncbi:hypothetical protein BVIR_2385 [Blastochloris viridis]|uniref:Uncharacterized protein n=1 Tax=Blastochloris viridis TaxID=1079 RepID=A0A0P0J8E3_BLAVI|nr:hypothetical protein BVIR_2385 [Blastochloris viridis]CUU42816.1 hypothetical protein BVIRIDIS_18310 [Blastochloris viridis]